MAEYNLRQDAKVFGRGIDTRYGQGSFEKLLNLFNDPSVIYNEIATEFGVTKAAVSLWHYVLFPDTTGHERRRSHALSKARDKLLENKLFSSFYRKATQYFPPESISPIPTPTFSQFRKRAVKLNGKKVILKRATEYHFYTPSEDSDYVFYFLSPNDFLFIPRYELPNKEATLVVSEFSKYHRFKNNFNALKTTPQKTSL